MLFGVISSCITLIIITIIIIIIIIIIIVIIFIIIIIIMSEYFYRIKVSVLFKYIQVKNYHQHLSCARPLGKKRGKIYFKKKCNEQNVMLKRKEKWKEQVMATFYENVKLKRRLRKMCLYQFFKLSVTISISYFDWQVII